MIAVYVLEQKSFLFCNKAFIKLLGTKIERLKSENLQFWFSNVLPKELPMVKMRMKSILATSSDRYPTSIQYHFYDGTENLICLKHEIVLYKVEKFTVAVNYLFDISTKERIERRINETNGQKQNTMEHKPMAISPRERQVLKLIADGYSTKQIAKLLYISNHTAVSHRKHLIEKFQVKNTAQMIKKASTIMEL